MSGIATNDDRRYSCDMTSHASRDETGVPATPQAESPEPRVAPSTEPSLSSLVRYFLRLGAVGFGGPVVLVERMRRDLEEDRR
jgi:hypothetical protein